MEQIYYTQCPVGYGLGASNGYQIKRISPGYPSTADLRHLGLRAFLPGSRAMAPPALRYRRDGDVVEIARLTPREKEFETERGLWGRPGGHFAHGLRLDCEEFDRLERWPAGLLDAPFWRTTDPEATRGRPPDPIAIGVDRPTLARLSRAVEGFGGEFLAALLAATAASVRDGRTLYVIGPEERLPPLFALLTFAFPAPLRRAITFSTYHDRPDELQGFRLQGTTPQARPNRGLLAASGIVADLQAKTIDPPPSSSSWSRSLAEILIAADETTLRSLHETAGLARNASLDSSWDDAWLRDWIGLKTAPAGAGSDWSRWVEIASWAGREGLASEWVEVRPPSWWLSRASAYEVSEARAALVATLRWPESWAAARPSSWGKVFAEWFGRIDAKFRHQAIAAIWKAIPSASRGPFLGAMIPEIPARAAEATLAWFRNQPHFDGAMLVPLEAARAAREAIARENPSPVVTVMEGLANEEASVFEALTAMRDEAERRPEAITVLAAGVARAYGGRPGRFREFVERWALSQGESAAEWLGPCLLDLGDASGEPETWLNLLRRTPEDSRPALARIALDSSQAAGVPASAFVGAVESLLLPLPEPRRPSHPSWAEAYLRRIASELDLIHKLYGEEGRGLVPGLKRWIYEAREGGELSAESQGRIERARSFTLALGQDAAALLAIDLPTVSPSERGPLLSQILEFLGPKSLETCLDCVRSSWPNGFDSGGEGLAELARPIAVCLAPCRDDPKSWLENLASVIERLGLVGPEPGSGYDEEGFASEILAATTRMEGGSESGWNLRQEILRDPHRWRILGADTRRDFGSGETARGRNRYIEWDRRIDQGKYSARFVEVVLNAASGPILAEIACEIAEGLPTLGGLPWWRSGQVPGAVDDLRDAFARLAPMDPIPQTTLSQLARWMRPALATTDSDTAPTRVSDYAHSRWRCLAALSAFHAPGSDVPSRLNLVVDWIAQGLPLEVLEPDDASRFVGWVVAGLDGDAEGQVDRLGAWIAEARNVEPDRVQRWADGMPAEVAATAPARVAVVSDLWRSVNRRTRELRDPRRAGRNGGSP